MKNFLLKKNLTDKFEFIPEYSKEFLSLFPHRYDYLWAEHPDGEEAPDWQTESRHPLGDRLILQGSYLFGVRFGSKTNYLMLDIDKGSRFHPSRDPMAIGCIAEALEAIGLCGHIALSSSHSTGIHLYFPFHEALPSWKLAQAAETCLAHSGFKPANGQLELYPNPKNDSRSLYRGHRLPLQAGSYLLNSDYAPIFGGHEQFVQKWRCAANRSNPTEEALDEALKFRRRELGRIRSTNGKKFLNDLNAEIEAGWTGYGQTNRLIGRVALREYIFFHALHGGQPLQGFDLQVRMYEVIRALPGYERWCRHKQEINYLIGYWANSVERCARYYPYGGSGLQAAKSTNEPTENDRRKQAAQARIIAAVRDMQQKGELPAGATDRFNALKVYGIGSSTLYHHKHFWHPHYIAETPEAAPDETFRAIDGNSSEVRSPETAPDETFRAIEPISFYACLGDAPQAQSTEQPSIRDSGEREGLSTTPADPPLTGREFARAMVAKIRPPRSARMPDPTPPPDERWWAQMALSMEVTTNAND